MTTLISLVVSVSNKTEIAALVGKTIAEKSVKTLAAEIEITDRAT